MSTTLLDSLGDLKRASTNFVSDCKLFQPQPELALEPLQTLVKKLDKGKPARPLRSPACLRYWEEYLSGRRSQLDSRTIRFLCWELDVATDLRFYNYLDERRSTLQTQSLEGLVRAVHSRWSPNFIASPILERVRNGLRNYRGRSSRIRRWQNAVDVVLGANGAELFSKEILEGEQSIQDTCEEWGIHPDTSYVTAAVMHAADFSRQRMSSDGTWGIYLIKEILAWTRWEVGDFKGQVSETILQGLGDQDDRFRQKLLEFVLSNPRDLLGDPRLPANTTKWAGMEKARAKIIQWLSGLDVVFFFEHVMRRSEDSHGRKNFWLRYVKAFKQSRPLLNREDLQRLRPQLNRMRFYSNTHGHLADQHSAFLLDFGRILVIEFNKMGACYVYERSSVDRVVPEFWSSRPFNYYGIKQKRLVAHWIVHDSGGNWKYKLQNILASYGIRPS